MKTLAPSLTVANMKESIRFYQEALGFEMSYALPGPNGELVHASIKNGKVELMLGPVGFSGEPITGDVGKGMSLYLSVGDDDDIDALFDRAKKNGARVLHGPRDEFWGDRLWSVADPDGYELVVAKHTRDVSEQEMAEAMKEWAPVG